MSNKRSQRILGAVTVLYWFSLYTYVPYFSPYLSTLGASATLAGLAVGSYGFAQMVSRIPIGITADLIHRQKIFITLGVAFSSLAALGMYLFPTPLTMLLFRLLSGLGAAMWVCYTTLYSSYFEKDETTKAIGSINALNNLGKFFASMLGGIVAQRFGVRAPFLLSFVAAGIAVVISLFVEDIKVKREPLKFMDVIRVGSNKTLLYGCILALMLQMIIQATAFSFISNLAKSIGADDLALGLIATLFTLGCLAASFCIGKGLADKVGERRILILAFAGLVLYCAAAPFLPSVGMLYALQLLGGFANGTLFTLLMALAVRRIESAKRSTAMGFYQAIYGIGMTIGPALMGVAMDIGGFLLSFMFMAAVALTALLGVLLLYKRFVEE